MSGEMSGHEDGGCSPEEMVARWKELGGWPLTLSFRAFNRYDFTTYSGGATNHPIADANELAGLFARLAATVPDDAPYPLLVRLRILRAGHDAPFLSHECTAESADALRLALLGASERAAQRFV
jgi:hypothetical protein